MDIETGKYGEMPIFEALEPRLLLDAAWTVMVYFAADNNLEEAAIADVNEMEVVGSTDSVNLLVQLDRIRRYDSSNGNWTDTRRGLIVQDTDTSIINSPLTSIDEANMGDPATLTNFIEWGVSEYPADNYAVILWDHGGGTSGVCWDDTDDDDNLTVSEVGQALADSGVYMDIIGFDACLMGMMEQACEIRTHGGIMVASEQTIPWYGWPFDTFLADLVAAPGQDAATLAAGIVTRYGQFYEGAETLSAVDLTAVGSLAVELDSFAGTVITEDADWVQMCLARSLAHYYGEIETDYRDLGTFLGGVASYVSNTNIVSAAQALRVSYDSTVISNHSGPKEGATGLSIYLPAQGGEVSDSYTGANFDLLSETQWDEFLQAFTSNTYADSSIPDAIPIGYLPITIAGNVGFDASQDVGDMDVDFYSLSVEAGQRIGFDIDTEERWSSLDSVLRLFDAGGTQLAVNDDGIDPDSGDSSTDSYLTYLFNGGGVYYIAVSGYSNDDYDPFEELSGEPGSMGDYDLLVRSIEGFDYSAYSVATAFEDISATGVAGLEPFADDEYFQLTAEDLGGFEFDFYGTVYQELYVSDNGLITFGSGSTEYDNTDLTTSPSQASIAPYWDDLVIDGSDDAAVLWEVRGSGDQQRLILQWNDIRYAYGSGLGQITFQAVLDETDNSMQFNYLDLESSSSRAEGASATVGIKDAGPQSPGGNVLLISLDDGPNNFVGTGQSTRIEPPQPVAPVPTHVLVRSSEWSNVFLDYLDVQGFGCPKFSHLGYLIPDDDEPLDALPWSNLDTLAICFSEDVAAEAGNLTLSGVNVASYAIGDPDYNSSTFTATWTLTDPIDADKLLIDLYGDTIGDFQFRFDVLPGDTTRDGATNLVDRDGIRDRLFVWAEEEAYGELYDLNGSGRIDFLDWSVVLANRGTSLPPGAPGAPAPAAGPQAVDELIAKAAPPVVPVASQPVRQVYGKLLDDDSDVNDDPIAATPPAPSVDLLLVESPSAGDYISESQAISVGLPTTMLYRTAGEYDLQSPGDDLSADGAHDLLADILAESLLAVPL